MEQMGEPSRPLSREENAVQLTETVDTEKALTEEAM